MRLAPRSRSPHGDLKTHSCCRLRDKRMMPIGSGWPMTLPRPPRPPTPLPPPPLPSSSTSNRPEPDVLPPVTIGGAGRRPAKNADRPRNRAGATPSSHICQARPSPLRRRRPRSSTPAATAHSSSTASRSATAAACSLSRRRPWLSGALSIPRLHQHQARQRPATVGTTLTPREDGGTLRPQARLHPGSSDPPPHRCRG